MIPLERQLDVLLRGVERVYSREELTDRIKKAMATDTPLRVKLGMDPTAPDLTLGHTVVLQKLRDFQDCGHKAVLIIGDFTSRIGDPTGRSKTRPMLTDSDVQANARTYLDQAGRVIDTAPDKLEIRHNSEWLSRMDFADVIRMAATVTVARMMERDTFAKRHKAGVEIFVHELFYPMMQAKDSVEIRADVELGGTDQTFNNLMGRDFQRAAGQPPQIVMVTPILVGTDGTEKMSKSLGNYIAVTDPAPRMFARIMSIPDGLMANYYELLTRTDLAEVARLCDASITHPRDAKAELAKRVTTRFHDAGQADAACTEFFRIHGKGKTGLPDELETVTIGGDVVNGGAIRAVDLVVRCGFAESNGQARRLIAERGIRLDGQPIGDPAGNVRIKTGQVLQRGKRRFVRLRIDE